MKTFIFILFTLPWFATAQDEVETATPLTSSIYLIEGAGGNVTAFLGTDGTLLVDDDFKEMSEKLLAKLKELKGTSPRFIINTHFHYDHTGGNFLFGPTATIIATTELRERLMHEQKLWGKVFDAYPASALPTLTYDRELTLHFNGEDVRIVHLPHGHTDGDSVVYFPQQKIVSMGDLYFAGMYPIFHPEHCGSLAGLVKNVETVLNEISDDTRVVPGHGPVTSKVELEKYHQMIVASVAVVRAGIQAHKPLPQIVKEGLPQKWESFSHGYVTTERWLTAIYNEEKNNAR